MGLFDGPAPVALGLAQAGLGYYKGKREAEAEARRRQLEDREYKLREDRAKQETELFGFKQRELKRTEEDELKYREAVESYPGLGQTKPEQAPAPLPTGFMRTEQEAPAPAAPQPGIQPQAVAGGFVPAPPMIEAPKLVVTPGAQMYQAMADPKSKLKPVYASLSQEINALMQEEEQEKQNFKQWSAKVGLRVAGRALQDAQSPIRVKMAMLDDRRSALKDRQKALVQEMDRRTHNSSVALVSAFASGNVAAANRALADESMEGQTPYGRLERIDKGGKRILYYDKADVERMDHLQSLIDSKDTDARAVAMAREELARVKREATLSSPYNADAIEALKALGRQLPPDKFVMLWNQVQQGVDAKEIQRQGLYLSFSKPSESIQVDREIAGLEQKLATTKDEATRTRIQARIDRLSGRAGKLGGAVDLAIAEKKIAAKYGADVARTAIGLAGKAMLPPESIEGFDPYIAKAQELIRSGGAQAVPTPGVMPSGAAANITHDEDL